MIAHLILASSTFFCLFIFILVIGKTLNNIVNQLNKLEYMLQKEADLRNETLEVRALLKEEAERIKAMAAAESAEEEAAAANEQNKKPTKK